MRFQRGSLRVEERAKGRTWILRFYQTRPSDGRRVERNVAIGLVRDFPSATRAQEELNRLRILENVNRDCDFRGKPITFQEIASHYEHYELGDQSDVIIPRSHTTLANYLRNLAKHIVPGWGKRIAVSILPTEVEEWLLSLRRQGLSNQTCVRLKNLMSLVFAHAQRHRLIPLGPQYNPLTHKKDGGAGVRCSTKSDYESMIISPAEARAIWIRLPIAECTMTLLAATTGLRISEVLGLQWADIDFAAKVIRIRRTWTGGKVGRPKTDCSRGTVPCGPNLMAQLQTWQLESPYSGDTDWCFPSLRKKGTQPRIAGMICEDYLRPTAVAIGILSKDDKRKFGWHVFRHSIASYLVGSGASPTVVQKLLRHSNVVTTLGLYSHAAGDDRLNAQESYFSAASRAVDPIAGESGCKDLRKSL